MFEKPLDLGAGKIRVQQKAGFPSDQGFVFFMGTAYPRCAAALPDDRVMNGPSGIAIPHHGGFALVGNADGKDRRGINLAFPDGFSDHNLAGTPDLPRVMFHPTRLREILFELAIRARDGLPVGVKNDRPGTGRALIKRKNISFHLCVSL